MVRFRIDDELFQKDRLTRNECSRLISHFKFLSSMDIGERRLCERLAAHLGKKPDDQAFIMDGGQSGHS